MATSAQAMACRYLPQLSHIHPLGSRRHHSRRAPSFHAGCGATGRRQLSPLASAVAEERGSCWNWPPSQWTSSDIESLTSVGDDEAAGSSTEAAELKTLKEHARRLLMSHNHNSAGDDSADAITARLDLVDTLQQLGVAYHFKVEIHQVLASISRREDALEVADAADDLYATALRFRLLRSNGFKVPQDVFDVFKDKEGKFKPSLSKDVKGLLGLYHASFFSTPGEATLADAKDFAKRHLRNHLLAPAIDVEEVTYALELPLHWRVPRLHARWFIDTYERRQQRRGSDSFDPLLLRFAKLDFNAVQGVYKEELRSLSRWWSSELRLTEKVGFARDRMVECFFWAVSWAPEPEMRRTRFATAKATALLVAADDVFDVYGATLDELRLFTEAVSRWDVKMAGNLPECMKMVFLAIFNTVNVEGYSILRDKGVDVIPYLLKTWKDAIQSFLTEATWCQQGYIPRLDEYLEVGWVSASSHVLLILAQCTSENITSEAMQALELYPAVVRHAATLFRIYDDVATSSDEKERGDVAKCLECYMHENKGATEGDAREHMASLVNGHWEEVNGAYIAGISGGWEESFLVATVNIARAAQFFYLNGDGFGMNNQENVQYIASTLLQPIPTV